MFGLTQNLPSLSGWLGKARTQVGSLVGSLVGTGERCCRATVSGSLSVAGMIAKGVGNEFIDILGSGAKKISNLAVDSLKEAASFSFGVNNMKKAKKIYDKETKTFEKRNRTFVAKIPFSTRVSNALPEAKTATLKLAVVSSLIYGVACNAGTHLGILSPVSSIGPRLITEKMASIVMTTASGLFSFTVSVAGGALQIAPSIGKAFVQASIPLAQIGTHIVAKHFVPVTSLVAGGALVCKAVRDYNAIEEQSSYISEAVQTTKVFGQFLLGLGFLGAGIISCCTTGTIPAEI